MRGPAPSDTPVARAANLSALPRRTYRFRMLGMGLAGIPVAAVLHENSAPLAAWIWGFVCCLLWPHLAYVVAIRSRDPFKAELRNFMLDSFFAGSWAPLMQFNVLPSALLVTMATADKVNSGIRGLWLRSLPGMAAAVVVGGLLTGFQFKPDTSMFVLLACLPILVIHSLSVSLSSYRLVRRLQFQNLQLAELSRLDTLTGLDNRRHWQGQAETFLARRQADGAPASLLLLDVDRFKDINDRQGHAVGDDVLRAIACVIQDHAGDDAYAGRLGGDEFVVALPGSLADAEKVAEAIRAGVEALDFPASSSVRCSISIGLAASPASGLGLREWMEAADRALYRAKHAGRNQTLGHEPAG